jgi:hypothetical protein
MVSQIFLNLFIAIVVDTYLNQQEAYALPVQALDIDIFVDIWANYDPRATGFISIDDLDNLI